MVIEANRLSYVLIQLSVIVSCALNAVRSTSGASVKAGQYPPCLAGPIY
jgi:hypothetical protein